MSRKWRWLLLAVAIAGSPALLGINGCGTASVFGIDEQSEIRIGQQAAVDIERQYGVVIDSAQTPRVQRIGLSIARISQRPNLPWSFKILNLTEINAVSLPGGPIYVTRGLLMAGVTDAELAGVLGHEIAHINQRHSVHAIQRAMTYQLLTDLVLGGSSQAVQVAADLAVEYAIQLPRSRQDEYESDTIGIRLAYNAGYPPSGLVQFLQRLATLTGPDRSPAWTRTHPLTQDRIARAQQVVAQVSGQSRPVPVALSEQEQKVLKQLADEKEQLPKTNTPQQSPQMPNLPTGPR